MEKITDDLNFISSLPDQPTLPTDELKRQFDKAGNVIKDYINDDLIPEVEEFEESVETEISTKIAELSQELTENIQTIEGKVNTLETNVNNLTERFNNLNIANSFQVTTMDLTLSTNVQYGSSLATGTQIKTGYKPLGVVGLSKGATTNGDWNVFWARPASMADGTITCQAFGTSIPNHRKYIYNLRCYIEYLMGKNIVKGV